MTGQEYEKYFDSILRVFADMAAQMATEKLFGELASVVFPEITNKKKWVFDGAMGIPHWSYIGPSLDDLKKKYNVSDHQYDI